MRALDFTLIRNLSPDKKIYRRDLLQNFQDSVIYPLNLNGVPTNVSPLKVIINRGIR